MRIEKRGSDFAVKSKGDDILLSFPGNGCLVFKLTQFETRDTPRPRVLLDIFRIMVQEGWGEIIIVDRPESAVESPSVGYSLPA